MKKTTKYMGMALLGTALLACPSCSDTWDEHYNAAEEGGSTAATETLWDLISQNPELSHFKEVAEKATYYRDEDHPQTGYTFKDMLQSPMQLTVWAPKNDAYTEAEWQEWLEWTETRGYTVQQQLMGNCIALWRRVATASGVDTLIMLNGKKIAFDKEKATMYGIPIDEKNIPAANGTMHTMVKALPFSYNLYEYIKDAENATKNKIDSIHKYVVSMDTTYFSESASVEGVPNIDGEPTYVDSVYFNSNELYSSWMLNLWGKGIQKDESEELRSIYLENFFANINVEDSAFVMLLPTNQAFKEAYDKLVPLYNYSSTYIDRTKQNTNVTTITSRNLTLPTRDSEKIGSPVSPEDFSSFNRKMDIITPTVFNLNLQPDANNNKGRWTMEAFMADKAASSPYVINTYGDTLRTDDNWDKTSLFDGTQVKMTNGVGIVADKWNFPKKFYKPDLDIDLESSFFNIKAYEGTDPNNISSKRTLYSIAYNEDSKWWIDSVGKISNNNFMQVSAIQKIQPKYEFRLMGTQQELSETEVMSGKYDIGVIMVPYYFMTSDDSIRLEKGTSCYITSKKDTIKLKCRIEATLNLGIAEGDKEITVKAEKNNDGYIFEGEKVDTIWLFKDYKFDYSYKNLIHCFPTLTIGIKKLSGSYSARNGYVEDNFCFDRIILRSKED